MTPGLKVLYASSEIAPLAKTGGLADVAGDLPPALAALGLEPILVTPRYGFVEPKAHGLEPMAAELKVPLGGRSLTARVWQGRLDGCRLFLLENDELFGREGLYGDRRGDYPDNAERFTFFSRGALELAQSLGQPIDIVHANDWQCGLMPAYLRAGFYSQGPLANAASVITIHNLAFMGLFPAEIFAATGLPPRMNAVDGLEFWGQVSFLKAGLAYADAITTVSPSYAREIQTPGLGCGLEGLLGRRAADLHGILNGADYAKWSPGRDPSLPANYDADDAGGKALCSKALLAEFGLAPAGAGTTVLGFVGRLTSQKGIGLILEALPGFMDRDIRVCILGSGEKNFEARLLELGRAHPQKCGVKIAFDDGLARRVYAGSDIFLMPSRFEPCGLGQIYALSYGAVPLVRAAGGLKDTVAPHDPATNQGTGFVFSGDQGGDLADCLDQALELRRDPDAWRKLMLRGMGQDFSWQKSAQSYAELYAGLARRTRP